MRYDFGSTTQTTAERFVGPSMAGGRCVGCHALSRDGTKLVAAAGGWDVEDDLLVDVATRHPDRDAGEGRVRVLEPRRHEVRRRVRRYRHADPQPDAVRRRDRRDDRHDRRRRDGERVDQPPRLVRRRHAHRVRPSGPAIRAGSQQPALLHGPHRHGDRSGAAAPSARRRRSCRRSRARTATTRRSRPTASSLAFNESTCPSGIGERRLQRRLRPDRDRVRHQAGPERHAGLLARAIAGGKTDAGATALRQLVAEVGAVRFPAHADARQPRHVADVLVEPRLRAAHRRHPARAPKPRPARCCGWSADRSGPRRAGPGPELRGASPCRSRTSRRRTTSRSGPRTSSPSSD